MERDAIDWTIKFTDLNIHIDNDIEAHLLVEVDGNDMDTLFKDCERISEVMEQFDCGEILFADSSQQKDQLWKMRRAVGEAVKSNSVYKEEDTVVPRAELPRLLMGVKAIGKKHGFSSVCYGHAGDGNLHINIIKGDMTDKAWNEDLSKGIREIFELTVSLGGTISGEHGIGLVQKGYMNIAFSEENISIQKGIKSIFDPKVFLILKKYLSKKNSYSNIIFLTDFPVNPYNSTRYKPLLNPFILNFSLRMPLHIQLFFLLLYDFEYLLF